MTFYLIRSIDYRVVRYDDIRPFYGIERSHWGVDLFDTNQKG